jgi:pyrroline-5-carboxylate reductase
MQLLTNKRKNVSSSIPVTAAKLAQQSVAASTTTNVDSKSKQSRVIAMLLSPKGATIAAMMKTTGWQQHSVRGFLAGVVRKRLKLKLDSKKIDDNRVYRITRGIDGKSGPGQLKHRSY